MTEALAGKVCPKCSYKRTATDTAPDWQCPKCGVAYAKAMAAQDAQAAPAQPAARYAPVRKAAASGPLEAVITGLTGFIDFSGRTTRSEYWWFFLFVIIVFLATGFFNPQVAAIAMLVFMLPSIAINVRRLHDIGKSGWWYLLGFIPVVGPFILLYFALVPSDGDNEYGTAPG